MSFLQLVALALIAAAAMVTVMTAAWTIQRKTGNSGWVDTAWSFGVGGTGVVVALLPLTAGGPHGRQLLVAALVAAWSVRLGFHIASRTRAAGDDPRYRALIEEWGADAPRRMFWFLQAQALVGVVLALSIGLAAQNPAPAFHAQDLLGASVLVTAVFGEAAADRQLAAFKANPDNRGRICSVGLWRWSRHPNYFFEWLGWLAYPLIAIDFAGHNPLGWIGLAAPACMYWVLVHASGIPPLEAHMLRTRGAQFRAYRQQTSSFFPWPPRGQV
jgi:steroid 5-alpha reductase family enzyme